MLGLPYLQKWTVTQFRELFLCSRRIRVGASPRADRATEAEIELDIDAARAGRSWDECIGGFYYIYPGRSSHGF